MSGVTAVPNKKKAGQPPGEEKGQEPNVKLDPDLHRKMSTLAAWKRTSLKALVHAQLEQYVAQEWETFLKAVK